MKIVNLTETQEEVGVLGNNRSKAVISNQIAIIMNAAIDSIAREERGDVDEYDCDMPSGVHNQHECRQATGARKLSTLDR